jgi:ABC-type uncharacterized transport system involved in gliding motility auxiliary subunit
MEILKKISFPVAAVLIVAALAVKMARPEWRLYANIGAGIGGAFFLLSLYFERAGLKTFFSARSTRYGLNSLVMILLVLGIVGIANWIISRHPLKYDSTKNKQFSLSSLTTNTLKNLKQPVKIQAFFSESPLASEADAPERRQRMKDLLNNYKLYSKNLDIQLIDPLKNKLLVDQYQIRDNGTTILESGKQKTTISTAEEEDLTNAILRVTSSKETAVYFLQGHDEPSISDTGDGGISGIVEELKKSNYVIKELTDFAAKAKVPDDCTVLVIVAPRVNLLDPEIKGIQDYLASGGRALILDDPQSKDFLSKILSAYRVHSRDDIVVDDQNFLPFSSPAMPLVIRKEGTSVTKEFNFPMFFPAGRSLIYDQGEGSKETFTVFAESSQSSWGETDKQRAQFEEGKDQKGPLTLGLMVSRPVEDKNKKTDETRLVVFGDGDFIRNGYSNIPGNGRIFANSVSWLSEQENLIHLPPRSKTSDVMMLSSTQVKYIMVFVIIVMPLAVLSTGITVWVRRKKL